MNTPLVLKSQITPEGIYKGGKMKKLLVLLMGIFILALPLGSQAMLYTFSESAFVEGKPGTSFEGLSGNATGSSELNFSLTGTLLKITIDNTSPLTDDSGNSNSPAITAFGFDAENAVSVSTFDVEAFGFVSGSGSGSLASINSLWQLDENSNLQGGAGGLIFDFVPRTQGIAGGLINPEALGETGNDLYETTATFSIGFSGNPGVLSNFYMRFKNLGVGGEGSLNDVPGVPVPEPASMLLLGSGLLGLAAVGRKKFFKKN